MDTESEKKKEKCGLCKVVRSNLLPLSVLGQPEINVCEQCAFFYYVFEEFYSSGNEEDFIILKDLNTFFSYKRSNEVLRFAELILEFVKNKEEFLIDKAKTIWIKRWKYSENSFIKMCQISQIISILGNRKTINLEGQEIDYFEYGILFIKLFEKYVYYTKAGDKESPFADRANIIAFVETLIGIGNAILDSKIDKVVIQIWQQIVNLIMDKEGNFLPNVEYYELNSELYSFECKCGDRFRDENELFNHFLANHPDIPFPPQPNSDYFENKRLVGYKYDFKKLSEKQDKQTSIQNFGRLLNDLVKHKTFILKEFFDPQDNTTYHILNPQIAKVFQKALIKTKEQIKTKENIKKR